MKIKVSVTDDHPMVVEGLRNVIATTSHIEVLDTYGSGQALIEGLKRRLPDVLLLDMQLPDIQGTQLVEMIGKSYPDIRIVILTSLESMHHIDEMMQSGCVGYLLKSNTDHPRLIRAIEQAWRNERFLDDSLSRQLLTNIIRKKKQSDEMIPMLTRRERHVLQLSVDEMTNQEIARELSVSVRTVECHRNSLLHKLNAKNTAGLVKKALEMRLLSGADKNP